MGKSCAVSHTYLPSRQHRRQTHNAFSNPPGSGATCDAFECAVENAPAAAGDISTGVAVKVLSLRGMGSWKTLDLFENEARDSFIDGILRSPAMIVTSSARDHPCQHTAADVTVT